MKYQLITESLIEDLIDRAQQSERGRTNYNLHQSFDENPNRFLNVMTYGSYFTPHRHITPPKPETFLILKGKVAFYIFDDEGKIENVEILAPDKKMAIDVQPGVWHCLAVLSETAVCFEIKPGPYVAETEKVFANWAPIEGSEKSRDYLKRLEQEALKLEK